jgi:hypothetical protein
VSKACTGLTGARSTRSGHACLPHPCCCHLFWTPHDVCRSASSPAPLLCPSSCLCRDDVLSVLCCAAAVVAKGYYAASFTAEGGVNETVICPQASARSHWPSRPSRISHVAHHDTAGCTPGSMHVPTASCARHNCLPLNASCRLHLSATNTPATCGHNPNCDVHHSHCHQLICALIRDGRQISNCHEHI